MMDKVDSSAAAALAAAGGTPPVAPAAPVEAPQRPAHVPEKFWDASTGVVNTEAWAKSTAELEAKLSGKAPAAAPETPAVTEMPPATPDAAAAAVGQDAFAAFSTEFAEKGALSEESFKALEAKGIPKPMVEAYIAGQMALAERQAADVLSPAGGTEGFTKMATWADKNLPAADVEALDRQLASEDLAIRKNAVIALKARYDAAYGGSQAGLLSGQPSAGVVGYQSSAEMTADMRKPEYAKDPAFRAMVSRKLEVSNF